MLASSEHQVYSNVATSSARDRQHCQYLAVTALQRVCSADLCQPAMAEGSSISLPAIARASFGILLACNHRAAAKKSTSWAAPLPVLQQVCLTPDKQPFSGPHNHWPATEKTQHHHCCYQLRLAHCKRSFHLYALDMLSFPDCL
jgi:hypothetical protein